MYASPILSVITSIGFDHMDYLGDTLEKIAEEKAGIMKPHHSDNKENMRMKFRARRAIKSFEHENFPEKKEFKSLDEKNIDEYIKNNIEILGIIK
jgi:dihydrofolate synthase/folylpolyglutamate synthase